MRARLTLLLFFIGLPLCAQPMSDRGIIEEIRENPWRAAAAHCPYDAGEYRDTPAPEGYTPFYVSHFSRHGSRYQSDAGCFDEVLEMLDTLYRHKLLTPCGDTLRTEIQHIACAHKGMDGMLTGRGTREQTAIARNLARRCPGIFTQPGRRKVTCTSTPVARTIQSMAGFSAGILSCFPGVDLSINSGFRDIHFKSDADKAVRKDFLTDTKRAIEKRLRPGEGELRLLAARLLTDPDAAAKALGGKDLSGFLTGVFNASAAAGCLDIAVDPFRFFTAEELFAFYRVRDVNFNMKYGPLATTREYQGRNGKRYLRLIVDEADAAIEGNGRCADFRFGHDANLGPMMTLLGVGPFQRSSDPGAPYRDWQSYRYICMGSNVQFIFYRNAAGDILVKALYNEREIDFPGLGSVNGVYYRWSDVRRYIVSRTDDIREVPEYYKEHLKTKSAEVSKLQKDEADGFWFICDTHFPANFGNAAPLIESLEHSTLRRRVVMGGDVITYVNDMSDGMAMQISSYEQIRGAAPVYWMRGNHDFVNDTGAGHGTTAPRKALYQWETAQLLARYRGQDAVCDTLAPCSAYFYYDNPDAKIRYVVIESTDNVADNRIIYGVSDRQLQWMAEEAILKAPEGYKLVFFSHVPLIKKDDKTNGKMKVTVELLRAAKAHRQVSAGGRTYDFSARKDLSVLGMICAHHHTDYVKDLGDGLKQINVIADCNYRRAEAGGTTDEQAFVYFSIPKDFKSIRIIGVGAAHNRICTLQ